MSIKLIFARNRFYSCTNSCLRYSPSCSPSHSVEATAPSKKKLPLNPSAQKQLNCLVRSSPHFPRIMRRSCLVSRDKSARYAIQTLTVTITINVAGVARTLTRALASPASIKAPVPTGLLGKQDMISAAGRYEGALLGLGAMGKQTVIHALLGNGGERLRILGGEVDKLAESERDGVISTAVVGIFGATKDQRHPC
jgi:hypothetical protein